MRNDEIRSFKPALRRSGMLESNRRDCPLKLGLRYTMTRAFPKMRIDEISSLVPDGTFVVDVPARAQKYRPPNSMSS